MASTSLWPCHRVSFITRFRSAPHPAIIAKFSTGSLPSLVLVAVVDTETAAYGTHWCLRRFGSFGATARFDSIAGFWSMLRGYLLLSMLLSCDERGRTRERKTSPLSPRAQTGQSRERLYTCRLNQRPLHGGHLPGSSRFRDLSNGRSASFQVLLLW
jgi:hypothetical protein